MRLQGKAAIVTGAASGIGKAIAQRLADEGASVCIADLDLEGAERLAETLPGRAFAAQIDIADPASISATIAAATSRFDQIDILINNAGTFSMLPVLEIDRQEWNRVFSVNVEGTFFMLQAVAKEMKRTGGGRIVNIASQSGRRGDPDTLTYCAAKAAVISLTQSSGLALIRHGINVNAIAPGPVDTPMWDKVDELYQRHVGLAPGAHKSRVEAGIPYGRLASPKDIANCAYFLVCEDSSYMTGQTLGVDGGNWLG